MRATPSYAAVTDRARVAPNTSASSTHSSDATSDEANHAIVAETDTLLQALAAREVAHDPMRARAIFSRLASERATPEQRDVAARAAFFLAQLDEDDHAYERAVFHYREVLLIDPGNWFAASAQARLEALQSYQGSYEALAHLASVREDARAASDPSAITKLYNYAMNLPESPVKAEALLFVAEAYMTRLSRPGLAADAALAASSLPRADPLTRSRAFELAYSALSQMADFDRAKRDIAANPNAPPWLRARVRRDVRRRRLHTAAIGTAMLGVIAGTASAVRSFIRRRGHIVRQVAFDPLALLFIVLLTLGGFGIGEAWQRGLGVHFLPFGASLLAVHALSATLRGAFGDSGRLPRAMAGATTAACVIAAAYLILEREELRGNLLLQGFGL
ncbi:MAG: hypothetical protein NVSMB1_11310 [Polyangiales bacterium]